MPKVTLSRVSAILGIVAIVSATALFSWQRSARLEASARESRGPESGPPVVAEAPASAPSSERSGIPSAELPQRLRDLLRAFRLEAFRPRQEAVCRAVAEGKDVLLVMPTGSGKSLCYQLPGLARGGATLVISPLMLLCARRNGRDHPVLDVVPRHPDVGRVPDDVGS